MSTVCFFHTAIFMPRFDFDIDFWQHLPRFRPTTHSRERGSHEQRDFPQLSLSEVYRRGRIYDVTVDRQGISEVRIHIPFYDRGRGLVYIVGREGLIRTGWWTEDYRIPRPLRERRYEER